MLESKTMLFARLKFELNMWLFIIFVRFLYMNTHKYCADQSAIENGESIILFTLHNNVKNLDTRLMCLKNTGKI